MLEDFLNYKLYVEIPEDVTDEQLHKLEELTGKKWMSGSHLWEFRPYANRVSYYCCVAGGMRYIGNIIPLKPWITLDEFLNEKRIEISDDEWTEILE